MSDIYLRGKFIITMNKAREIIKDGCVAVEDGRITAVGKCSQLDKDFKGKADFEIDASRHIIMPGLIDTHVHLVQGMLKACANYLPLIPWLKDRVWPLQGNMTADDALAAATLTMLEMIKTGTTTFLETGMVGRYGPDRIIERIHSIGLRAAVARHVMDMTGYATEEGALHPGLVESGEQSMGDTVRLYNKYHGWDGRIFIWFGPRTPGAVSVELYREMSAKAKEMNTGITMHLAEVRDDLVYLKKEFGKKPIEFVDWVGLTGPNVVLVHLVWIDDDEIRKLAETGTHVSHNPSCNSKLGSGIARVSDMLKAGVNVTLGCDGGPSNDNYDLIEEMKLAALLQTARTLNPEEIRAEDILEMATIRGAKALNLEKEVGSIEVGKKADIITINYWDPKLMPLNDPVSHIVYAAHGDDVSDVIIDGKLVMRNRKVLTIDEEQVLKNVWKHAQELFERTGICREPDVKWPIL
ncbi:MAG: amidohydrolase [Thermoprotei archaeon]|nr:MAG: amidohydrolase [Thermoprotei archaeon]